MRAGRKLHHEGTKGTKWWIFCAVCTLLRFVGLSGTTDSRRGVDHQHKWARPATAAHTSALVLVATVLAAHCSPLRAGDTIDPETLDLARSAAMSEWNGVLDQAMRPPLAQRQMLQGAIGTLNWTTGVIGLVSYDLLKANPDRGADILLYVNSILIPEMYARRDQFVCGYTRLHYHKDRRVINLGLFVDRGFTDPFIAIAYFVTPTRDYLEQQNLDFTPRAVEQLERHGRFAPGGSFWRKIAASKAHLPCKPQGDADSGPGDSL